MILVADSSALIALKELLMAMQGELSSQHLMEKLSLKDRKHFAGHYLQPALIQGLITPTIPEKPNSWLQKYRLTLAGDALLKGKDK